MTKEEIIQAISDDKMMPFIQPEQLAQIVAFVINNYQPSLPSDLDEAAEEFGKRQGIELAPFAKKFFKRGAKWMAEQGYTVSSGEPDAMGDIHTDWLGFSHVLWNWMVKTGFCKIPYNGDLVVQIRKKQ